MNNIYLSINYMHEKKKDFCFCHPCIIANSCDYDFSVCLYICLFPSIARQ